MRQAYARQVKALKKWSEEVAALGRESEKRFIGYCQQMMRESFIYNQHRPELNYTRPEEDRFLSRFAPFINAANIEESDRIVPAGRTRHRPKCQRKNRVFRCRRASHHPHTQRQPTGLKLHTKRHSFTHRNAKENYFPEAVMIFRPEFLIFARSLPR